MFGSLLVVVTGSWLVKTTNAKIVQASTPPRGFNTFDGFGNGDYNETDVMRIADALASKCMYPLLYSFCAFFAIRGHQRSLAVHEMCRGGQGQVPKV